MTTCSSTTTTTSRSPSLRGNGIGIGFWGDADNTIIRYSKIHDVGQCQAYDHLIYLSHGNNVQIYDNWLYNDAHGRGVQLYPAPTNARVFDNVIDHAGEGFVIGNEAGDTVSGNQIYNNVITNSTGLPTEGIPGEAIHDLYGGTPGHRQQRSTTTSSTGTRAASAVSPRSAPTTTRAPTRCSSTPPSRTSSCSPAARRQAGASGTARSKTGSKARERGCARPASTAPGPSQAAPKAARRLRLR